jgi:hypothetical protein
MAGHTYAQIAGLTVFLVRAFPLHCGKSCHFLRRLSRRRSAATWLAQWQMPRAPRRLCECRREHRTQSSYRQYRLVAIKHFTVRERFKVDLAGQAFNFFNHAQFLPGGSINNATSVNNFLGNVQAYATVSNPLFNNPTSTFSSNPRVLQITATFF